MKLAFEMTTTVVQTIAILDFQYTEEKIVEGLRNSTLFTSALFTIDYIVDEDDNAVARIINSEEGHFELENFRIGA